MDEQEMIDILEDLARNGGDTARISAIRLLRAWDSSPAETDDRLADLDEWRKLHAARPRRGGRRVPSSSRVG
jgi:hypothetical protein